MSQHVSLVGAKGGAGCSTVAALVALEASKDRKVYLSGYNTGDLHALLGVATNYHEVTQVSENLWIGSNVHDPQGIDLYVHDHGVLDPARLAGLTYLVTRPCYLALRRALDAGVSEIAGIVLVNEPGRALGKQDVEAVLGKPVVATIDVTEATARTIDAGLLAIRPPRVRLASLIPALTST